MTPERFRQIEELYHAAREGTAEERAALLAHADPELRRELESLLVEPGGDELLDRPAIGNAPHLLEDSTRTELTVGASLGPYRIESKLGEGGMGQVFRAVDTRLGRAVAVKTAHERFGARFEREARVISSLNHPNICTVYDVGPNYLVMELGPAQARTSSSENGAPLWLANCGCIGGGARPGDRSSRPQTGQHHDREIRRQGSGFRTGEIGRGRNGHVQPNGDGYAGLHGAGTKRG